MNLLRSCCRWASPSTLLLALLLFPLPWLEIQCPSKATTLRQRLLTERQTVHTQSGWQALRSTWSNPGLREETQLNANDRRHLENLQRHLPAAPLLAAYLTLLLAGLASGLLCRHDRWRRALVAGCTVAALTAVAAQRWQGLPLEQAFRANAWESAAEDNSPRENAEIEDELRRSVRYTGWFWLAQYGVGFSLLLILVEAWAARLATGDPGPPSADPARTLEFSVPS